MMVNVGLAAVSAMNGNSDKALDIIEALAKNGAPAATLIEGDSAFESLSAQPRFVQALESMKQQAAPCKYHDKYPKYRELDFWVGDWDVYGKGGALSGHSQVELIIGDCVLNENWTDMTGGVGKSYNKYNQPSNAGNSIGWTSTVRLPITWGTWKAPTWCFSRTDLIRPESGRSCG